MEAVTSDTSLKALRHLYDTIEAQVHGLKSMGVNSDEYGSLLSSVVLSKIPLEIWLIIRHEIGDGDRKLDNLMKILLSELRAREGAEASDIASVKGRERTGKPHSTAAALLTGGLGTTPTCYYRQQAHL